MRRGADGFTLLELVISIGILLLIVAVGLPDYKRNLRQRAVVSAARFIEARIRFEKERAVALGAETGFCFSGDQLLEYEYHPFFQGSYAMGQKADLAKDFAVPVTATVVSTGAPASPDPCASGSEDIQLSPAPDSSSDWQGTVSLDSGGAAWQVQISGGLISDEP